MVSMVSRKLSPLLTLDVETLKFIVSADSRLAAVSKLNRVRVESSKNKLTTVLPRKAGTFGTDRVLISAMLSVSLRIRDNPSAPSSEIERRCFKMQPLMPR
jgi:hypothetical protein